MKARKLAISAMAVSGGTPPGNLTAPPAASTTSSNGQGVGIFARPHAAMPMLESTPLRPTSIGMNLKSALPLASICHTFGSVRIWPPKPPVSLTIAGMSRLRLAARLARPAELAKNLTSPIGMQNSSVLAFALTSSGAG